MDILLQVLFAGSWFGAGWFFASARRPKYIKHVTINLASDPVIFERQIAEFIAQFREKR